MTKQKIIFLIIFIQLLIIIFLGLLINKRKNNVLGAININSINKEDIDYNPTSNLKYFYEPKANKISIDTFPKWVEFKEDQTDINPKWLVFKDNNNLIKHRINNDSLNEEVDYSINKENGTYRILTLGDSFTYGIYVQTKDNWSKELEYSLNNNLDCNKIKKFEVINLGVQGYDIQYAVERFRIRGQKYQPDLVLWLLKNDDFLFVNDLMMKFKQQIYTELINSGEYKDYVKKGVFFPEWTLAAEETSHRYPEATILKFQQSFLNELNKYYSKKLLIFAFPTIKTKYRDIIVNFANQRKDTYYFDQITNIYEYPDEYFKPDTHPTEKGYKNIANDLFNYLTTNKILSCN